MANQGTGITFIKEFTYRGDATERWSNTYWFYSVAPNSTTEWDSLWPLLWELEKFVIPASSSLVQVYGYDDRTYKSHAVYDHAPATPLPGELSPPTGASRFAGDQAAMCEWRTDHKNTRGKWVYLRKYLHDGFESSTDHDRLDPTYQVALQDYAEAVGTFHGGLVPGPSKADPTPGVYTITGTFVKIWVTTRTLKRRGKRPKAAP